jgi:ANTAR domain-containing protein
VQLKRWGSSVGATAVAELDAPAAIGRATAVMMSRYGVDVDRAQTLLVRIAQRRELQVETLARRVVAVGAQPRVRRQRAAAHTSTAGATVPSLLP